MARSRAVSRAVRAVRASQARQDARARRRTDYATVRATGPIKAELHHTGKVVEEDEGLTLGQWVRRYDDQWGIDPGETLLVHLAPDDDWVAVEVLSDKDMV